MNRPGTNQGGEGDFRPILGDLTNKADQTVEAAAVYHGKSGEDMDEERKRAVAYEYLCHLEEAKDWMSVCVKRPLPAPTELEDNLRNGVALAELAAFFAPKIVQKRRIFDLDQEKFRVSGLHFRHTDNINFFLKAVKSIGLPEDFQPETTDIYDKKNMPRVIFGIHALAHLLYKMRLAPPIQDLYGKVTFTAEEISNMQSALDQYGLAMPAFRKIGGIMAEEMAVDEAALHAAVIAINDALEHTLHQATLTALQNPSAGLTEVDPDSAKKYHIVLADAKAVKASQGQRPHPNATVDDAYDQLLTREEIQAHVNKVNLLVNLEAVERSVTLKDKHGLFLRLQALKCRVVSTKTDLYLRELSEVMTKVEFLRMEDLELAVHRANESRTRMTKDQVVAEINRALNNDDVEKLSELLTGSNALGVEILPSAIILYFSELNYIRQASGIDLGADGIVKVTKFLLNVAKVNQAVAERCDHDTVLGLLTGASLLDVNPDLKAEYFEGVRVALSRKKRDPFCPLLNHADLQDVIDEVNNENANSQSLETIEAIKLVNEAVRSGNAAQLHLALSNPNLDLRAKLINNEDNDVITDSNDVIREVDAPHHLRLLRDIQRNRSHLQRQGQNPADGCEVWMEDIVEAVEAGRRHVLELKSASFALAVLNIAVLQGDLDHVFQTLQRSDDLNLPNLDLQPQRQEDYLRALKRVLELKNQNDVSMNTTTPSGDGDWVEHRLSEGDLVYLDLKNHRHSWVKPRGYSGQGRSSFICSAEVEFCVHEVNNAKMAEKAIGKQMPRLQALCRGYLVRKNLFAMLQHYYEREHLVIKVQSYWRARRARKKFREVVQAQMNRVYGGGPDAREVARTVAKFRPHVDKIVRIQRAWRSHKGRMDFQSMLTNTGGGVVSVTQVRKYLHLVDLSREDFEQELELQTLKGHITKMIRGNQALEKDLDAMDIKIGLLVSNQIDVQEVLAADKSLLKKMHLRKSGSSTSDHQRALASDGVGGSSGLKALKKESREKLDAYQHLFYLLQTNPEYLAKLIFVMPQSNSTRFMESVILTLYNFGANAREEFLLLNLFKVALEEEVASKVERPGDLLTGNPLVVCMIVRFYRAGGGGKKALRNILGPLITNVLEDKSLHINISPVEIYKQWINSMEYNSGQEAGMPYDVTAEQALKYEEVRKRLQKSITKLKQLTTLFLATIVKSGNKLPYGILYIAKVLRSALRAKFPQTSDKELLKIVGNLIYYRYINSAIAAPDGFDIVASNVTVNSDQRRNLGSIAKILQAAAMKKGFGDETSHLVELNAYIVSAHEKFKNFFVECCKVPEPEDQFMMNRYTEVGLIAKPVVYITLQEICDTHSLLLKHRHQLTVNGQSDKLHELLDDLGDEPSLCSLLGATASSSSASLSRNGGGGAEDRSLGHLAQTEVCLTLTNKFALSTVNHNDTDRLFIKTKQLIALALPCTSCSSKNATLIGCLKSVTTRDQEETYWDMIARKEASDQRAVSNQSMLEHTNLFADDESRLSLEDCKRQILKNLQILERHGYVSAKDGCNAIVSSLAKDISNQKEHRARRRREIIQLRNTIKNLERKSEYYHEQVEYYHKYLKQCLANLQSNHHQNRNSGGKGGKGGGRGGVSGSRRTERKRWNNVALKYSAAKLNEKGILISIDGLPSNQFKNVQFEIVPVTSSSTNSSPSSEVTSQEQQQNSGDGLFQIHAKFMGVRLEHVDIDIQDLLQLQYEGVAVMNVFGKAKINVNLFLHLLNSKFYSRRR